MIEKLSSEKIDSFRRLIYDNYNSRPRVFPWRQTNNPYHILISEIMLQQTQTERVDGKYQKFIQAFPDFNSLASATPSSVLPLWQGLGYNRRALMLIKIAQIIMNDFKGFLPSSPDMLENLPGIGKTTAGEIAAFAFNYPAVFIETNIRRVFIHFFFPEREKVRDSEILPLVEMTLDRTNPRVWYYALMDYGVMLKRGNPNPNIRSAHYKKQSPFHGSNRQVRGTVLKFLASGKEVTASELAYDSGLSEEKIITNLEKLEKEGFLGRKEKKYFLKK
jgi:A/G-specific adenine glycosylase